MFGLLQVIILNFNVIRLMQIQIPSKEEITVWITEII